MCSPLGQGQSAGAVRWDMGSPIGQCAGMQGDRGTERPGAFPLFPDRFSYNEPMSVESCTQSLCDLALRFGEGDSASMARAPSRIAADSS